MSVPRTLRKEVIAAVVLVAAAAAWTATAQAQPLIPGLPGSGASAVVTVPGSVTSDAATEQNTAGILQEDTAIATSVTTGGGGGNAPANAQTIASFDQSLFPGGGVNSQNFGTVFPGWQSCAPDCTDAGEAIDNAVMAVYQGALSVAQQQEQELVGEGDLAATIDQNVAGTTDVLYALQGMTDLLAMGVQEQRYIRQQNDTIITLLATHYSQDLNDSMQQLATQIATTPGEQQ